MPRRPVSSLDRRLLPQKNLQQVVQKPPPERCRRDARVIALDQAAALGFVQLAQRGGERLSRPLFEQARGKAVIEAQRIHHELEGDIGRLHLAVLLDGVARLRRLHIALRKLDPRLAHDAVAEAEFAVRPGADAEVIAESPIVEIVPAGTIRDS